MNRKTPKQQLAELDQKQEEIDRKNKEDKAKLRAEKRRVHGQIKKEERRLENKKKILVGAMYLDAFKDDPEKEAKMLERLDGFLTRKADREVFGFATEETEETR